MPLQIFIQLKFDSTILKTCLISGNLVGSVRRRLKIILFLKSVASGLIYAGSVANNIKYAQRDSAEIGSLR